MRITDDQLDYVGRLLKEHCYVSNGGCVPQKLLPLEQPDAVPEESPFDRVRQAILDLPNDQQRKIYLFLYSLGHRI